MLTINRNIPEHFCWFVFQALIDALVACETGFCNEKRMDNLTPSNRLDPDWRTILHLNIKPDNILLGDADTKNAFYQRPVLANFGNAVCLDLEPVKRRQQMDETRYIGTKNWQAPEQRDTRKTANHYPPSKWDLNHGTDIYAVEPVIRYTMICNNFGPGKCHEDLLNWESEDFVKETNTHNTAAEYQTTPKLYRASCGHAFAYSTHLIETVRQCLAFRREPDSFQPKKKFRPTLFQLRDRIREAISKLDLDYGDAYKTAAANPNHPAHVLFPEDDYQIGSTFVPRPNLTLEDLTVNDASAEERSAALESWAQHAQSSEACTSASSTQQRNEAVEAVFDDIVARSRTMILQTSAPEQDTANFALEHATNTIKKCVAPAGRFKQVRTRLSPSSFSPEQKQKVLRAFERCALELGEEVKADAEGLKDKRRSAHQRLDGAVQEQHEARTACSEGEVSVSRLGTEIGFLEEQMSYFDGEMAAGEEKLKALALLLEVVNMGLGLLVAREGLGIGEGFLEGHWMTRISDLHQGIWEYFWSRPDGVYE